MRRVLLSMYEDCGHRAVPSPILSNRLHCNFFIFIKYSALICGPFRGGHDELGFTVSRFDKWPYGHLVCCSAARIQLLAFIRDTQTPLITFSILFFLILGSCSQDLNSHS